MLLTFLNDGFKYLEYIFLIIATIFFLLQIKFNQDSERIKYIILSTLFYILFFYFLFICFSDKRKLESEFYLLTRHIVFIIGVSGIVTAIYKYLCDVDLMDLVFGSMCFFGIYLASIVLTNVIFFS